MMRTPLQNEANMEQRNNGNTIILSIGVTSKGNSVVRVMLPTGSQLDIETNLRSFAALAAAGIKVVNGGK